MCSVCELDPCKCGAPPDTRYAVLLRVYWKDTGNWIGLKGDRASEEADDLLGRWLEQNINVARNLYRESN